MECFRIYITSWTASFRYPNLISGYQPTLEVPPLSTVLGLINAAAGYYQEYKSLSIGYYFQYEGKPTIDLETIYQIDSNKGKPTNNAKSNVINREFLFNNSLYLYLQNEELVNFMMSPYYSLLLGRMNDLASILEVKKVQLEPVSKASKIKGQIVPLIGNYLPGQIQALPKYFSNEIPRNALGTEAYSIIPYYSKDFNTELGAYRDVSLGKNGIDIYFHNLDFQQYE